MTTIKPLFVIDTIRAVARRVPREPALITPSGSVSYAELDARISGLSAALRSRGIGPGSLVGVCLPRSAEMVIAILGVLGAGAAYVPLDPEYPSTRIRHILEDSGVSLLLSDPAGDAVMTGLPVVRLDPRDWPAEAPPCEADGDGIAYLIYTSGSTGKPKGVVIEHAALDNYLAWCLDALPFTGGGVPLFGSISFDHVVTTLFPVLMKGEPLILLPPIQGGRALAEGLLSGRRYSYVKITPSHLRLLDEDQRAALGRSADLVMSGGERMAGELVGQLRRDAADLAVMNHYGPTEATVGCCVYRVPLGFQGSTVPIGRPIRGFQFSVRRKDGTPAPKGEPGELYVGGVGLAQGYWRRPDLTAAAFVLVPDEAGVVERYYRTGDVVVERPSGDFEHLGRADDQVKIFGHRVEPMEVEAVIRSHPSVAEAAVLPIERAGFTELIAAVVSREPAASEEDLRKHVRGRMPAPMVPARILFLDHLPMTGNGKLDRQGIVRAASSAGAAESRGDAPLEDLLAAKWREVLGIEVIGQDDDFFDLGGDSLATVDITAWASERFHVPLEPPTLFEYPTLRTLAARIAALGG